MSTKGREIDEAAKARVIRSEVEKQGVIRKSSFARDVQSLVDKRAANAFPRKGAGSIKKR